MGNCVTPCSKGRAGTRYMVDKYDQEPIDTELFKEQNTIKIPFSATFANVKVKKCPYKNLGMKISLDSEQYFQLGFKPVQQTEGIKVHSPAITQWKIQKRIDFHKTEYELRKSFLCISLMDETEKTVAFLRINLYTISVGPYHQDFKLKFKNEKIGRISFDFKVSQLIEVELQSKEAEITLNKKHPGQLFSFSIKAIVSNDAKISRPSYAVEVALNERKSQKFIQQEQSRPRRRSGTTINQNQIIQLKQNKDLFWDKRTPDEQMPSIEMKILLHELHHSYFQILLIKYDEENYSSEAQIRQELFAECFISFNKLFNKNDPDTFEKNGKFYQSRNIEVNQKLWIHGKQKGKARFIFHLKNQKYIKQMQVCVRTEEGILKTSPILGWDQNSGKTEKSCKQIDELSKLSQQIESHVIQLEQCQDGYFQIRKLKSKIQQNLCDMIPILQKTSKQSMICYTYYSEKEMIKAQKVLINIGQKITSYLEEEDLAINQLCWLILIALIRRGQFMLSHIGFDERERKQIQTDSLSKITTKKMQAAVMYQQFMYKLLDLALKSLNFKGSQTQRTFAQIFCAYAYFRIPDFRAIMLTVITKEDDLEVPQWRGIQFSLDEDTDYTILRQDVESFTALFEWQHNFHKCIKNCKSKQESSKQDNYLELNQILVNDDWKYRFQKRGPAFFSFIKYWVAYVQGIVIKSRDIQWKYFPGYNRLLKAFFLQMKKRKILEYPDSLKQTANKLVVNHKILNPIVTILFSKANIYEPLAVIKSIEFISDLLNTLESKNKPIGTLFNYSSFFQGIKICLESEFLFVLEATLILIYSHFHMFHVDFKRNLLMYLLKKVFFSLFLHWSDNIRNVFYHLLIYRIGHEVLAVIPESARLREQGGGAEDALLITHFDYTAHIRPHYQDTVIVQLEKAKKKYQEIKKESCFTNPSNEKSLHKTMKKKLIDKKLAKAKRDLLSPKKKNNNNRNLLNSQGFSNPFNQQYQQEQSKTIDDKKLLQQHQKSINNLYKDRFIQPRVQRSQSQCLSKNKAEVIYKSMTNNTKQQVINLNKSNSFKIKNQILDTTNVRDSTGGGNSNGKQFSQQQIVHPTTCANNGHNSGSGNGSPFMHFNSKRLSKQFNPIFQMFVDEFGVQLVQPIDKQLQYIPVACESFQKIKQQYQSHMKKLNGKMQAPKIKRQEMAIDQKELMPHKIDDW